MDIRAYWNDALRQDEEALAECFDRDAHVSWHCTNERFTAAEFIRANCAYPGEWEGELERVHEMGDLIITAARVWARGGEPSFHVTSFFRMKNGKISSIDEYWGDDGEAPKWRREMHLSTPIR